jgi:hypothetical protein
MFYVRCGVVPGVNGSAFYTFPANCRIKSRSLGRRTMPVEVPFADGVKDIADGKVGKGALGVTGRIKAADADAAEHLCLLMEHNLVQRDNAQLPFYVWTDRNGGPTSSSPKYPVTGLANNSTVIVDAVGEVWVDIAVTFIRNGVSI